MAPTLNATFRQAQGDNSEKIKTIFFGTPEFAVHSLEILHEHPDFEVKAVVPQPDKAVGRQKQLTPPPVKAYALEKSIEVLQPATLRRTQADKNIMVNWPNLGLSAIDVFVVVAYGKILPKKILAMPKYGTVNVHFSRS